MKKRNVVEDNRELELVSVNDESGNVGVFGILDSFSLFLYIVKIEGQDPPEFAHIHRDGVGKGEVYYSYCHRTIEERSDENGGWSVSPEDWVQCGDCKETFNTSKYIYVIERYRTLKRLGEV